MSGHSHWAGIKHKKAANDAKRGRVWSKIARMIIVAAKAGGGDPGQNLTLRYAIDKAKAANMPKDTIEKAVKKGTGELGAINYEDVLYEGYAPGGVAVMVDGLTDNRNRTAPEIKKIFEKRGGSLGASGCVNWMFSKKGLEEKEIPTEIAEISMVAQNMVPVADANTARKILGLMEDLEDHDDVQNVYANFDIPDDILAKAEE